MVWDILKKGLKELAHGAKSLATNIQLVAAANAKKRELKRALLNRFTVRQLDEIAARRGISLRGARTKREKVDKLAFWLSFDEVVALAKRYRIKYKDILEEFDRFKASIETKRASMKADKPVEELIQALQSFKPEPVRDEEELEKQLYQYLKARFPDVQIRRQVRLGPYRIDMMVGNCGIEIKIPRSATHLQRLIGQVRDYSEHLDCVIALVLDVGAVRDLSSYLKRLIEHGIQPVVVEGRLKKRA